MTDEKTAELTFEVDERIYPLEAAQQAAYAFTDRAYVRISAADSGKLQVRLTAKAGAAAGWAAVGGEFDNELLHQALRVRVARENQKIRELIVTRALVSAQPVAAVEEASRPSDAAADSCPQCASEEASAQAGAGAAPAPPPVDEALEKEIDRLLAEIEKGDAASDPLGVSVPWEEKFGAAKAGDKGKKAAEAKKPKKAKKSKKAGEGRA